MSGPTLQTPSQATPPRQRRSRRRSSTHSTGSLRPLDRRDYTYAVPESSISEWLKCPICLNPFVQPVVATTCEHVFCRPCIEQYLHTVGSSSSSSSSSRTVIDDEDDATASSFDTGDTSSAARGYGHCPTCRAHFHASQLKPATTLIRNMVDSLLVKCPHEGRGCTHTCERGLLDGHARRECGWMYVGEYEEEREGGDAKGDGEQRTKTTSSGRCDCGKHVLRKDWQAHVSSGECSVKRIACPFTDDQHGCRAWLLKEDDVEAHLQHCPARPVHCSHCHASVRQGALKMHEELCDEVEVSCPLHRFGCPWHGRRVDLGRATEGDAHTEARHLTKCKLQPLQSFLESNATRISDLEHDNAQLYLRLDAMEEEQSRTRSLLQACCEALGSSFLASPRVTATTTSQPRRSLSNQTSVFLSRSEAALPAPNAANHEGTGALSVSRDRSASAAAWMATDLSANDRQGARPAAASAPLAARAPSAEIDLPWQWPETENDGGTAARSDETAAVRLIASPQQQLRQHGRHVPSTSVSDAFGQLYDLSAGMSERMAKVERCLDDAHVVSLNASFEASRAHEELNSVRHGMHSVRLQMHSLLMQQQYERAMPGHAGPASMRIPNDVPQQPGNGPPAAGGPALSLPSMIGVRRFWTGFEQTKL